MNFFENIKYRWKHERSPLPGELEPIDYPEGKIRAVYSSFINSRGEQDVDEEKIRIFRKIRGLLGYGQGWSLLEVFKMYLQFFLPVILLLLSVLVFIIITR
jgi:hypothetical protein